jgi:pilus assembly protein CpaE
MNALSKPDSGGRGPTGRPTEPILAFACDEDTLEVIARVVPGGRRGVEVREGGLGAAGAAVQQGASPELLIVDISDSAGPVAEASALVAACGAGTTVVALGPENDVGLYRALLGAGVTDYLVKPVTGQELRRTILTAGKAEEHAEQTVNGRVGAVIGTRGGVGASSVAIGIAWAIAHDHRKQVALLDLDMHFGTVALSLDLEPGNGLRSALENADRIDSLFVASALVHLSDNLFVLGGEEPLDQPFTVDPEPLELLLAELRRIFDMVVLDVPRHMVPQLGPALAAMNGLAVVTDLSLAGLRDTVRIRSGLTRIAPDVPVRVVASRVGLEKGAELPPGDFEKGLGAKIDHVLAEEPKAAKGALNGKPLATLLSGKRGCQAMQLLARQMGGIEDAARPGRSWFGLRR